MPSLNLRQLGNRVAPPGTGYQPAFLSEHTVSLMSGCRAVLGSDQGLTPSSPMRLSLVS